MKKKLSYYFLEEPLTDEEAEFAAETLLGSEARFPTGASEFQAKRIPNVLPVPGEKGPLSEASWFPNIEVVKRNLRKAGIRSDGGVQILFVLPKQLHWGALFQSAIYEETGFFPYTLQRWYYDGEEPERREPRIVDVHGLTVGKG